MKFPEPRLVWADNSKGASGILALCVLSAGILATTAKDTNAPPTARHEVVDTYYGASVSDPYRWLEDTQDKKVHQWSAAQDRRTRKYLDGLPQRKAIFTQLMKQTAATSSSYYGLHAVGDQVFAFFNQPPNQQPMIAVLGNAADPARARVILNPNVLNPKGTTAIDWFVPSPNGALLAVSLSENGSEDGSVHVFDAATGKQVGEVIPRVQYPTGGGSLAWRADSKGFWYTRYPGPERPPEDQHFFEQIYFHLIGEDPAKDAYVLGKDFPKVAEIELESGRNPKLIMVSVANGDGGEFEHYVIGPENQIKQITHFADKVVTATIGADDTIYLVSHADAPRGKLLKLQFSDPGLDHAKVIVPQSEGVIQPGGELGGNPVVVTATSLYVRELLGGPSRVKIFDHEGKLKGTLPLPDVATVNQVEPLSDGTLLYSIATYLRPPFYSRYEEASGKASETALAQTSPVNFADTEVLREFATSQDASPGARLARSTGTEVLRVFATSQDGTQVPLNIIRRKGTKLDGTNPVLLTGYGGYSVSLTPQFLGPRTRLWLDGGGVFVIANLRGGGEFGEEWHKAGALTHKQNVFDDFLAAARYLIAKNYTMPERLAILGGSNGGLLMGAAFTQQPEMFRAVVSQVGIYDMLRVELDPNGLFNTTEFGTVKDPDQYQALSAYSPYHHVVDGAHYPAIFMATGETDGRVNPAHSRKMIARLQAATGSDHPVLLSINAHAGHGIGSALSIRVNQDSDTYAFLFDQLGMKLPSKPEVLP